MTTSDDESMSSLRASVAGHRHRATRFLVSTGWSRHHSSRPEVEVLGSEDLQTEHKKKQTCKIYTFLCL